MYRKMSDVWKARAWCCGTNNRYKIWHDTQSTIAWTSDTFTIIDTDLKIEMHQTRYVMHICMYVKMRTFMDNITLHSHVQSYKL